MTFYTSEII